MHQNSKAIVGLNTYKLKISIAVADDGRQGEVRFLGAIDNTPEAVRRLVHKLASRHGELLFCDQIDWEQRASKRGRESTLRLGRI